MDELARWFGQQLDEDELIARRLLDDKRPDRAERWEFCDDGAIRDTGGHRSVRVKFTWPPEADHIVRHDPARVLREIDAKRRTLERHSSHSSGTVDCSIHCERAHPGVPVCNHDGRRWPCPDVLDLTAGYTDRPGFKESWRP